MQELCAHVRNGYVVNKDAPFEFLPNGSVTFNLILGYSNELAIAQAEETTEHSVEMEEAQYRRDVAAAAKSMLEQRQREEYENQIAAQVAKHKSQIRELELQAAETLACLQK
jgi:hypothetical protein